MLTEAENNKLSKFLSLVLRHKPESIGIHLDPNGWTSVEKLIAKINATGQRIDLDNLKQIVATNNKKRFAFDSSFENIRASQGHSINIDLGYRPQCPPSILYHGTARQNLNQILLSGLQKRKRHHVHLSADEVTATKVGQRHGQAIVLEVLAGQMFENNFEFFLSENGVWLTDSVPVNYLKAPDLDVNNSL